MRDIDRKSFVTQLMSWYAMYRRSLPWRATRDPYRIWLSEVILQQTRVAQGLPYYERFVAKYPCVEALAKATQEEVLHLWQGLGYYGRARRLHLCAQYVTYKLGGTFPSTYKGLLALPGIGTYTAAAIASMAFGEQVGVVDGNVYRVLGRLLGVDADITSHRGKKLFTMLAADLVPAKGAGAYNQALMEFGALHCTTQQPMCVTCPFQSVCVAYQTDRVDELPVKSRCVQVRKRYFHYLLLHDGDEVYVRRRDECDIWAGLYDFYLVEGQEAVTSLDGADDFIVEAIKRCGLTVRLDSFETWHQLTHQRLHVRFFHVEVSKHFLRTVADHLQEAGMRTYKYEALKDLPFPRVVHRFFDASQGRLATDLARSVSEGDKLSKLDTSGLDP